jgi:endonuclease-8
MPEGDTIFRAARSLHQWLEGREVTAARTHFASVPVHKLVGQRVSAVEAKGKHLLIRFDSGMVLHTHMRMTGTWHVYAKGERWRKPAHQARVVLEAGDRVAVCFNVPVVELLAARGEEVHPSLARLGPDILSIPLDPPAAPPADHALDTPAAAPPAEHAADSPAAATILAAVRQRAAARPPETPIGELLLDQQVVSGIGNIWRCETLFANRVDPWTPHHDLDAGAFDALITTAARLMQASANANPSASASANATANSRGVGISNTRRPRAQVYGRTGRPCLRCRTPIRTAKLGQQARDVYWCPTCQGSPAKRHSSQP